MPKANTKNKRKPNYIVTSNTTALTNTNVSAVYYMAIGPA